MTPRREALAVVAFVCLMIVGLAGVVAACVQVPQ
jgi:hypothetical protein